MSNVLPFDRGAPVTLLNEFDTYLLEHIGMPFSTMLEMLDCFGSGIKVTIELDKSSEISANELRDHLCHDVTDRS